jgi:hypothetical protein
MSMMTLSVNQIMLAIAARAMENPPLERTAAAVYLIRGRTSRVRRRGRSTSSR